MRRQHFRRQASTLSSLPALKPEGIAAHSSGPRRIRLWHVLDAGHFALDTKADEIATLVGEFMKTQKVAARSAPPSRRAFKPDGSGWRARIGVLTPDDDAVP